MGIRDRLASKAQAPAGGDYPDAVKLTEVGDEVAGIVTAVRTDVDTQYGDADVLQIDDEIRGEEVALWATSYQLKLGLIDGDNALGRQVETGDEVYIRFEGKVPTDNGNTVNTYAIAVAAGEGNPDDGDDDDDVPF